MCAAMHSVMAHDLILITNRRQEVEQEIARLKSRLEEMDAELVDLATAEKVLARLSGAERGSYGPADKHEPKEASGERPNGIPQVPEMIMTVMTDMSGVHRDGMKPTQVTNYIRRQWWPDIKPMYVSTTMWRMAQPKDGRLVKSAGGVYRLPSKENPEGAQSGSDTPSGLDLQPAEGGEARPGGGT